MKYCPYCAEEILKNDVLFCMKCGEDLSFFLRKDRNEKNQNTKEKFHKTATNPEDLLSECTELLGDYSENTTRSLAI